MYSSNNFSTIGGHFLVNCPSFNNHKAAPAGQESVCILVSVPFMNEKFWEINTNRIAERVLGVVSRVIPEIDGNIISKTIATPVTYKKFTSNRDGAAYGWAGIPSQVTKQVLTPKTNVQKFISNRTLGKYGALGSPELLLLVIMSPDLF
jgi:Phytoene dehydrogenase and related proteins